MIQRILQARNFLACILAAATGMALYLRAPFPDASLFLQVMARRSSSAFLFFKYSYTLFLYTTPYIAYSVLFPESTFSRLRPPAKLARANYPRTRTQPKDPNFRWSSANCTMHARKCRRKRRAG